jgi:hypothetical protein
MHNMSGCFGAILDGTEFIAVPYLPAESPRTSGSSA